MVVAMSRFDLVDSGHTRCQQRHEAGMIQRGRRCGQTMDINLSEHTVDLTISGIGAGL